MPAPISVTFERFPQSLDAFRSLQGSIATTPQGGVAMMVIAEIGAQLYSFECW